MCWTSKQSHRRQNAENGLKDRFPSCHTQSNRCNARLHAYEKRPKSSARKDRIDCVRCVFLRACIVISGFWLHRKPCIRCVLCAAYDGLESTYRPGLWKRTWRSVSKLPYATQAGHTTQIKNRSTCNANTWKTLKNAMHAKIELVACITFFTCVQCIAYFGFLIASQAACPLRCVCCVWQLGNHM